MNNLAVVLNNQGKYKEAEAMERQTLELKEKVLSKEHPDILLSVYCLVHSLAKRDSFVEATTLYLLVSQGLGFDCNQMVGKLVVCIFRDV
jgi:hypothetical protein